MGTARLRRSTFKAVPKDGPVRDYEFLSQTIKSLVKEYNVSICGSYKAALLVLIEACVQELIDQGVTADVWMGPAWHAPLDNKLLVLENDWGHLIVEEH